MRVNLGAAESTEWDKKFLIAVKTSLKWARGGRLSFGDLITRAGGFTFDRIYFNDFGTFIRVIYESLSDNILSNDYCNNFRNRLFN